MKNYTPSGALLVLTILTLVSHLPHLTQGKPKPKGKSIKCYSCYYMKGTTDPQVCRVPKQGVTGDQVCVFPEVCGLTKTKTGFARECVHEAEGCTKKKEMMTYACATDFCNSAHSLLPVLPVPIRLLRLQIVSSLPQFAFELSQITSFWCLIVLYVISKLQLFQIS